MSNYSRISLIVIISLIMSYVSIVFVTLEPDITVWGSTLRSVMLWLTALFVCIGNLSTMKI